MSTDAPLNLTDRWDDTLEVDAGDAKVWITGGVVELTRDQVADLRDYLTEWLGDLPSDVQENLDPAESVADYIVRSARPTCCGGEDNSPCCPTVPPATILEDAQAAVYGDRQEDYAHPRENFTRTAIIWTGLLQHKLADGAFIDAEDIPRCMIGLKLARDVHSPKRDNRVDGAGYFLTLDRLETGR